MGHCLSVRVSVQMFVSGVIARMRVRARTLARARERACDRVCARACARACACDWMNKSITKKCGGCDHLFFHHQTTLCICRQFGAPLPVASSAVLCSVSVNAERDKLGLTLAAAQTLPQRSALAHMHVLLEGEAIIRP